MYYWHLRFILKRNHFVDIDYRINVDIIVLMYNLYRVKCVACRVISHEGCISTLNDRFPCKETFRACVRTYREQTLILHHWVTRLVVISQSHNGIVLISIDIFSGGNARAGATTVEKTSFRNLDQNLVLQTLVSFVLGAKWLTIRQTSASMQTKRTIFVIWVYTNE